MRLQGGPLTCTLHAPQSPAASRLPARISLPIVCLPFDSAVHTILVRRQQAAHPLRVGGHLGLRLCWLWPELGSGKLRDHIHDQGRPEGGGPGVQR